MPDLSSDPLPPCPPEVEKELDRRIAEALAGKNVISVDEMRARMAKLKGPVINHLVGKLPTEVREKIAGAKMDGRHDRLNELLDEDKR